MKRQFYLLFFFIIAITWAFNKAPQAPAAFYLYYSRAGLGSNMGSMQPVLRIQGTSYEYTSEQNSFYSKRTIEPQKVSSGKISAAAVDSILLLVKNLHDTAISRWNPCIMSGGVSYLSIVRGKDTVSWDLHNTTDTIPVKVINILNPYFTEENRLYNNPEQMEDEKRCNEYRFKKPDEK